MLAGSLFASDGLYFLNDSLGDVAARARGPATGRPPLPVGELGPSVPPRLVQREEGGIGRVITV